MSVPARRALDLHSELAFPLAPDVPYRLRELLTDSRRLGIPFYMAWDAALFALLMTLGRLAAADWGEAFEATRDEWQRCYEGEGRPLTLAASLAE